MGNQLAAASSSYVFTMWVIIVLLILIYSTFIMAMWWYYRQLQEINKWQDGVRDELDNAWRKLHKHTSDITQLAALVNSQADKTKTNLQLIADKINEMNGYDGSETQTVTKESVQEVVPPSPVVKKEVAPKEIVEGNETLPNNVIQFPGLKKPK